MCIFAAKTTRLGEGLERDEEMIFKEPLTEDISTKKSKRHAWDRGLE